MTESQTKIIKDANGSEISLAVDNFKFPITYTTKEGNQKTKYYLKMYLSH